MKNHRAQHALIALLGGVGALACAGDPASTTDATDRSARTTVSATTTAANRPTMDALTLPPIDLRAPSHLETATFALG